MLVLTIDNIPNKKYEVLGLVKGSSVRSKHIGKDIIAGFKQIVGGEIKEYHEMMEDSRKLAIYRMIEDAKSKDCDAIIGFRLVTSSISSGVSELTAYGTGVKYE